MGYNGRRVALFLTGFILLVASIYGALWSGRGEIPRPQSRPEVKRKPPNNSLVVSPASREFQVGKDGRLLFITVNMFGKSIRLLLDTGCSRTGFDNSLRPLLGEVIGTTELNTLAGSIRADLFQAPGMSLGGLLVKSEQPVFCYDLREMQALAGEEFLGILGMDVLRDFVVQINWDKGILRLAKRLPESPDKLGVRLPIEYKNGCAYIAATCGSAERLFLLDTGSNKTCVDRSTFAELANSGELITGASNSAAVPSGASLSKNGLLGTFSIGPFVHSNVLCDSESMSILGLRSLSRYLVTFDFPNGVAYMREGNRFPMSDPRGVTGLWPFKSANGFLVHRVAPQGAAEIAGIRVGDEIIGINDQPASEMDMFSFGEILTGCPGQEVRLKLRRHGIEMKIALRIKDRFSTSY